MKIKNKGGLESRWQRRDDKAFHAKPKSCSYFKQTQSKGCHKKRCFMISLLQQKQRRGKTAPFALFYGSTNGEMRLRG